MQIRASKSMSTSVFTHKSVQHGCFLLLREIRCHVPNFVGSIFCISGSSVTFTYPTEEWNEGLDTSLSRATSVCASGPISPSLLDFYALDWTELQLHIPFPQWHQLDFSGTRFEFSACQIQGAPARDKSVYPWKIRYQERRKIWMPGSLAGN